MNEIKIHIRAVTRLEEKMDEKMTLLIPGSFMSYRKIGEHMRTLYQEAVKL